MDVWMKDRWLKTFVLDTKEKGVRHKVKSKKPPTHTHKIWTEKIGQFWDKYDIAKAFFLNS